MKTNFKMLLKKVTAMLLAFLMVFAFTAPTYAAQTWNKGEKVNYAASNGDKVYKSSDWAEKLAKEYQITWYENPTREVLKGEFMLVQLRTIQASLARRGLPLIFAYNKLDSFKDIGTVTKAAKEEITILNSLGILSGTADGYMNLGNVIKRSEAAKILDVTNKQVLQIAYTRPNKVFKDMKGHWAEKNVSNAYQTTLINGTSEKTFSPNDSLTIEQTLQILENEVGYYGITRADVAKALKETFKVTTGTNLSNDPLAKYSPDMLEVKMNIYAFNNIYDNGSAKPDEKVTKVEALKMVVSSIYNYSNFDSFWFYPEMASDAELFKIMKERGVVDNLDSPSGELKYIDVLRYFANAKKAYLNMELTSADNLEIKNISKYSVEDQKVIKDMVANKIIEAPNNELPLDKPVVKGMVNEIVVNFVERYSTITPNKEKLNTNPDNIPSNYKDYPYTLASVDKKVYEMPNISIDDDYKNSSQVYGKLKEDYASIEESVNRYLDIILNVDYTTFDEAKFKQDIKDIALMPVTDVEFREFFKYVKSNKIQTSGTSKVQFPAIYFDGITYNVRTEVKLNIQNADQPFNLLFLDLMQPGNVKYEGKNITRIIDIPVGRYVNSSQFAVYVTTLTPIPISLKNDLIVIFKNTF
ncbi:MAG: S-layer homology domain-containing protein [Lutispora sp.]|nr:S-layer homology domain-containing protein [Lutispora sp.]